MHARIPAMVGLALLIWTARGAAQDLQWRASTPAVTPAGLKPAGLTPTATTPAVTLGRPEPVNGAAKAPTGVTLSKPRVVRGQFPDPAAPPPPPPPPPPAAGTPVAPFPGMIAGEEPFNCGVANTKPGAEGFFGRFCDHVHQCWNDLTGSTGTMFQSGPGGTMFQSEQCFNVFISPVTNPFYFEDPRALTEVRPIFMWQRTPNDTPMFAGGDNFYAGVQGRVAFTDRLSLVVHQLGWVWSEFQQPAPGFANHAGLSEIHLGPKFTVIRNQDTQTLLAIGAIFELPVGDSDVFQDTGDFSITPYFSFGQNFLASEYGSFNFLNTTGYSFGIDDERSDFAYSSFHLSYDVLNLKKFYPLVEMNVFHYTANGNVAPINFEGRDMFHFGSNSVRGNTELTIAAGGRYKVSENLQFGLGVEFGLINRERSLDEFRVTVDMILRY